MIDSGQTEQAIAFVKVWQAAGSTDEVSKKLGLTRSAAAGRASHYRRHGIPLKRMPGSGRLQVDWDAVRAAT